MRIRVPRVEEAPAPQYSVIHPIRESLRLLQTRRDFAIFQWGFMIGGFALMLTAPVRSIFIADSLPVSMTDVALARCVFVGIGIAGSSLIWRKALELFGIHRLVISILLGFGIFPLILLLATTHLAWFYLAHLLYGIVQGGSHLIWNLSGTIFAGEENSTPFTTVSVLMIGIRGAVGPVLGGFLCESLGPVPVLFVGSCIALAGAWIMHQQKVAVKPLCG
jgi:predicted MFS family arabinose efflux permease